MGLFSNRSQRTSKCGKNNSDTLACGSCATSLFLRHFDVICDLLLNRRTATWNLFVNFCFATNQNNPHILKYVSYDRSRLLQPCGKLFSWAPPVPLENVYPLAPPHPLGISIDHPWGGGVWIFSGITHLNTILFYKQRNL